MYVARICLNCILVLGASGAHACPDSQEGKARCRPLSMQEERADAIKRIAAERKAKEAGKMAGDEKNGASATTGDLSQQGVGKRDDGQVKPK